MSVNKVTAFGENLIDLTEDTVTKETLIKGVTAHDASGNSVTGTFDTDKYLEKTGDASNTTAVFSASKERANISTGEKLSVIFGKIAKFFSDLKTVAFTGNYSDLSGTPSVVSETADGLCPKNGGTTTKFLRDDGTYAVPTSSVIGLSTLEQVTAAATAGNVTAPVGAGALAEVNSSLNGLSFAQDSNGKWGYKVGADAVIPFNNFEGEATIIYEKTIMNINSHIITDALQYKIIFASFWYNTTGKYTISSSGAEKICEWGINTGNNGANRFNSAILLPKDNTVTITGYGNMCIYGIK